MTGRRKLIGLGAALLALLVAGWGGFLGSVIAGATVALYGAFVGGNVGEHFSDRKPKEA